MTPPQTTASSAKIQTSGETQISPIKTRVSSKKPHLTEQKPKRTVENAKLPNKNLDEQRTMVAPAHNHTETAETSKNSRCGWEQVLHGPTVGA